MFDSIAWANALLLVAQVEAIVFLQLLAVATVAAFVKARRLSRQARVIGAVHAGRVYGVNCGPMANAPSL